MPLLVPQPPPSPDRVLADALRAWLAGRPRYYAPLQAAARTWLAAKNL